MAKILAITLNTAYDLIGSVKHIELGEVNNVTYLGLYPAGKGINVAKVLKDLHVDVSVSGFLGQDNQGEFKQMLAQYQLPDYFHSVAGATRMNVKITESDANVTDLNFQGYEIQPDDWQHFVKCSLRNCQQFDLVAVCGSLPRGITPTQFADWLTQLTHQGVKIVLDTSHAALTAGVTASPWLVKPNHRELEAWAGYPLTNLHDIIVAAEKLQAQGITHVVVSMGAEGAIWLSDKQILQAQPPKCPHIVSTVGAGDSMVAGLIYGFTHQLSQQDTLAFASAISALAVSQTNVGIPDQRLLSPLLEQVKMTLLQG